MHLKTKDIAGYVPFGIDVFRTFQKDMVPLVYKNRTTDSRNGTDLADIDGVEYKPVLYLTEEIIQPRVRGGKEIVPLLELFKMATGEKEILTHFELGEDSKHGILFYYLRFPINNMVFMYADKIGFSMSINGKPFHTGKHKELIEMLYEYHLDINGLIKSGFAINKKNYRK